MPPRRLTDFDSIVPSQECQHFLRGMARDAAMYLDSVSRIITTWNQYREEHHLIPWRPDSQRPLTGDLSHELYSVTIKIARNLEKADGPAKQRKHPLRAGWTPRRRTRCIHFRCTCVLKPDPLE